MKHPLASLLFIPIILLAACAGKTAEKEAQQPDIKSDITSTTIALNSDSFIQKVANYKDESELFNYLGDKPALIDFYADWCAPCKRIAPYLEELAAEYGSQIYIYKVDVDKEPDIAAAYGIQAIPTLILMPINGKHQIIKGERSKEELKRLIEETLLQ